MSGSSRSRSRGRSTSKSRASSRSRSKSGSRSAKSPSGRSRSGSRSRSPRSSRSTSKSRKSSSKSRKSSSKSGTGSEDETDEESVDPAELPGAQDPRPDSDEFINRSGKDDPKRARARAAAAIEKGAPEASYDRRIGEAAFRVATCSATKLLRNSETITAFEATPHFFGIGTSLGSVMIFDREGNFVAVRDAAHKGTIVAVRLVQWFVVSAGVDGRIKVYNWLTESESEFGEPFLEAVMTGIAVTSNFNLAHGVVYIALDDGRILSRSRGTFFGFNDAVVYNTRDTGFLGGLFGGSAKKIPVKPIRNLTMVGTWLLFSWHNTVQIFDLDAEKPLAKFESEDPDLREDECRLHLDGKLLVWSWGSSIYYSKLTGEPFRFERLDDTPHAVMAPILLDGKILMVLDSLTPNPRGSLQARQFYPPEAGDGFYCCMVDANTAATGDEDGLIAIDSFWLPSACGKKLTMLSYATGVPPEEIILDEDGPRKSYVDTLAYIYVVFDRSVLLIRPFKAAELAQHQQSEGKFKQALEIVAAEGRQLEYMEIADRWAADKWHKDKEKIAALRTWAAMVMPYQELGPVGTFVRNLEIMYAESKDERIEEILKVASMRKAELMEINRQRKLRAMTPEERAKALTALEKIAAREKALAEKRARMEAEGASAAELKKQQDKMNAELRKLKEEREKAEIIAHDKREKERYEKELAQDKELRAIHRTMEKKLKDGFSAMMYGEKGPPQERMVRVSRDLKKVEWEHSGADREAFSTDEIIDIWIGPRTNVFHRASRKDPKLAERVFSLITKRKDKKARSTLDIELPNREDRDGWAHCFAVLINKDGESRMSNQPERKVRPPQPMRAGLVAGASLKEDASSKSGKSSAKSGKSSAKSASKSPVRGRSSTPKKSGRSASKSASRSKSASKSGRSASKSAKSGRSASKSAKSSRSRSGSRRR